MNDNALNQQELFFEKNKHFFKLSSKSKWWIYTQPYDDARTNRDLAMKVCNRVWRNAKERRSRVNGTFGDVAMVKIYDKTTSFVEKIYKKMKNIESIIAEVNVLSIATIRECEFIPKLIYSGYTRDKKWCVIMEYIDGGTLQYNLFQKRSTLVCLFVGSGIKLEAKRTIAYQIALGLNFLHDNNLTHGDLKLNNIALTADGHARLFDFGHSRDATKCDELPPQILPFSAPEVLKKEKAGLSSDLWSYGVILAYLLQEEDPFDGDNDEETTKLMFSEKPNIKEIKNKRAKELIIGLLKLNPKERIIDITGLYYC